MSLCLPLPEVRQLGTFQSRLITIYFDARLHDTLSLTQIGHWLKSPQMENSMGTVPSVNAVTEQKSQMVAPCGDWARKPLLRLRYVPLKLILCRVLHPEGDISQDLLCLCLESMLLVSIDLDQVLLHAYKLIAALVIAGLFLTKLRHPAGNTRSTQNQYYDSQFMD